MGGRGAALVRHGARRRAARARPARERQPAAASHARPLRRADRRGRVRSGMACAARPRRRARAARVAVARTAFRSARRARRGVHHARRGRGRRRLSALDDVRSGAGASRGAVVTGRLGSAAHVDRLRPGTPAVGGQGGRAVWDGDDGAAGRLGRPCERDGGAARGRCGRDAARSQVVLLGADVRRVPRARAGTGRLDVLPASARAPGRRAERIPHRQAEGQAR